MKPLAANPENSVIILSVYLIWCYIFWKLVMFACIEDKLQDLIIRPWQIYPVFYHYFLNKMEKAWPIEKSS